jgi:hypothetical protein
LDTAILSDRSFLSRRSRLLSRSDFVQLSGRYQGIFGSGQGTIRDFRPISAESILADLVDAHERSITCDCGDFANGVMPIDDLGFSPASA